MVIVIIFQLINSISLPFRQPSLHPLEVVVVLTTAVLVSGLPQLIPAHPLVHAQKYDPDTVTHKPPLFNHKNIFHKK